jgi:hypothetical protein
MAKDAAPADQQAAAYWRHVARADRAEAGLAQANARDLSAAARQEERVTRAGETQQKAPVLRQS